MSESEPVSTAQNTPFYARHEKIYPREVKGRYASLRNLATVVLLGLFYSLAWLQWDGHQAVLFDLPHRKFHVFGLTFWPQDFFYLAVLLIIAALSLFFVTAVAGRLWCGYACPQTVWTELFLWIEHRTEGNRNKRMKLDRGPWNGEKILRKGSKQVLWVALAAWTGLTFVGYFTPIRELVVKIASLGLGPWETFWVGLYGFATYLNAGFLREQVCKYMCPYARFQSAMFDKDSLVISYLGDRGEPRGPRPRKADPRSKGLGDCIDCKICVQVCPTGIDIRDGLQYECIACAACIDACNDVMDKMAYPRGLIRYTTEHAMQGHKTRVMRPRILVYAVVLVGIAGTLAWSMSQRTPLRMDILRDRNALYRPIGSEWIENVYTLKVINMQNEEQRYRLSVSGLPGLRIESPVEDIVAPPGEVLAIPARVRVPAGAASGSHDIRLLLQASNDAGIEVAETTRFYTPVPPR